MIEWLTGGTPGYMPRIHCLREDWATVAPMVLLQLSVILGYTAISLVWRKHELAHAKLHEDGAARALRDLRLTFLVCALVGYGFAIVSLWWPAYRLLVILLVLLNVITWRCFGRVEQFEILYRRKAKLEEVSLERDEARSRALELEARLEELRTVVDRIEKERG